jgi:hypothetical protein
MKLDFSRIKGTDLNKALQLIKTAQDLKMELECYGEVATNSRTGNVYLWLEDYPFVLFIGPSDNIVRVLWTDTYTDEEVEECLDTFSDLDELYYWIEKLEEESNENK